MNNIEKLNRIFCEVFSTNEGMLDNDFNKDTVDGWDSVRQLSLSSAIEDTFDIMLDPEDILGLTSYEMAKSILAKYDIQL